MPTSSLCCWLPAAEVELGFACDAPFNGRSLRNFFQFLPGLRGQHFIAVANDERLFSTASHRTKSTRVRRNDDAMKTGCRLPKKKKNIRVLNTIQ